MKILKLFRWCVARTKEPGLIQDEKERKPPFRLSTLIGLLVVLGFFPANASALDIIPDTGGHDQIDQGNGAQQDIAGVSFDENTFSFAWDEPSLSGNNSSDVCSYFQNPGSVDVTSICYSVTFDNIDYETEYEIYTCEGTYGNGKCTGNNGTSTEYAISCTDPVLVAPYFTADPDEDLQASCTLTGLNGNDPADLQYINTCTKPSASPASLSNDCIFDPDLPDPGFLQLIKEVDGGTAIPEDFTLTATKTITLDDGTTDTLSISGDGSTGVETVLSGTWSLSESSTIADSDSYKLAELLCLDDNMNIVSVDNSVEVSPLSKTICTFKNKFIPAAKTELTLVKEVINDNGGLAHASAWTLNAGANSVTGSEAGAVVTDQPGTYALSESDGPDGYTGSNWSCSGGVLNGSEITIASGDEVTCKIINNDDAPSLRLVKKVTNDNGGSAQASAWTLYAGDNAVTGSETGALATVLAGTYALSESDGPAGYTGGAWSCAGGVLNGNNITVALGEEITCTIVNDDNAPSLTLVKKVTNDNGGSAEASAWTLNAGANAVTGSETGALATVQAGTYALSETGGPAGYTGGVWNCAGGVLNGINITVALGEEVICTVVNDDDAPKLTLLKTVDNLGEVGEYYADNSDFTLKAEGSVKTLSGVNGVTSDETFHAGNYVLSEAMPIVDGIERTDYALTSLTCKDTDSAGDGTAVTEITLAPGDDVTCTFANTLIADPKHSLVKDFVPNEVPVDGSGSFTLTYTNDGNITNKAVEINDTVNPILQVTSVIPAANCTDTDGNTQTVECDFASVAPGASVVVTVEYDVVIEAETSNLSRGANFVFYFENGYVLSGSTATGIYTLRDPNGNETTPMVDGKNQDIVFTTPNNVVFPFHLSCSEPFVDGWPSTGQPAGDSAGWQVVAYDINRFNKRGFIKSCGQTFELVINNTATASAETDGLEDVTGSDSVTIIDEMVEPPVKPPVEPPVAGVCDTAFAKGNTSFNDLFKRNKRWGWAEHAESQPYYSVNPIMAGQNADAGTLSIDWSNGVLEVTATINSGWSINVNDLHIYTAATKPRKSAPGQYDRKDGVTDNWSVVKNADGTTTYNSTSAYTKDQLWLIWHSGNTCR